MTAESGSKEIVVAIKVINGPLLIFSWKFQYNGFYLYPKAVCVSAHVYSVNCGFVFSLIFYYAE